MFSTVDIDTNFASTRSVSQNYKQAVHWKLVTIKVNISEDIADVSDFDDVGGSDFVFLPYPVYNTSEISAVTGMNYKTSHPVISGLSDESIYIKSLNAILKTNKFAIAEISEKVKAKNAYEFSTKGSYNEYGDFLGKSDIAQVRLFNTGSFDMSTLLGINIAPDSTTFYPYYLEEHWKCSEWDTFRTDCFEESPVDSIFIGEYNRFTNKCLCEFNFNELDEKSIRDSNGNGNKAILFGDYSIEKEEIGKKTIRDSYIKVSKLGRKNGAI